MEVVEVGDTRSRPTAAVSLAYESTSGEDPCMELVAAFSHGSGRLGMRPGSSSFRGPCLQVLTDRGLDQCIQN